MTYVPTYDEAFELLKKYNEEPFHLKHAKTVAAVMGNFAEKHDPERKEFWRVVGLLHDLDFERYPDHHCVKCVEIMEEEGLDETLIHAVASHGWGLTDGTAEPEHIMEKILFTVDELTGIIGAAALMRPSKSVQDMNLKSVKKKFKDKKFAAGCSRDVIERGAELLEMPLNDVLLETLEAMKATEDEYEG